MTHLKRGYILFLLFTVLSVCSVLISLYFSQVLVYRQLIQVLINKEKTNRLAQTGISLVQAIMMSPEEKKEATIPAPNAKTTELSPQEKLLIQLFDCWNKELSYQLSSKDDGFDAKIFINVQFEQGKLNLNSLFDFEKKKFLFEGTDKDRKKLCVWLFDKIAALTKKPSLFVPFEKYLKERDFDINDVTELLSIKEFADIFQSDLFITFEEQKSENPSLEPQKTNQAKIYLTDIFTVCTEKDTINAWVLSPSWCKILDLKPKQKLSDEEKKKIFSQIANKDLAAQANNSSFEKNWNKNLTDFYQKEYKDLAKEIKTILTTEFEANIFSLLLKANIGETNSTIFTIVKAKAKDHLVRFEIVKTYQI
jgi:hypothetical protein